MNSPIAVRNTAYSSVRHKALERYYYKQGAKGTCKISGLREDAGATVSDEQMRSDRLQYPVDRYLVNSSEKVEMVNILGGDIWKPELALKPEDEIVLRKLHDMLQSTADDLKMLSGELSKYHQPSVQMKSQPTPLDEEFNEKVHIEEIVNAKFHGYNVVEESLPFSQESIPKRDFVSKMLASRNYKPKAVNASVQVNTVSSLKKPIISKKLQITRPKIVNIKENKLDSVKETLISDKPKRPSTIFYNEISHQYVENKNKNPMKSLQIQNMPTINIRSELKEQRVLQLDILPDCSKNIEASSNKKNIDLVTVKYECSETIPTEVSRPYPSHLSYTTGKPIVRKVSKISCESSESTNNISSTVQRRIDNYKFAVKKPKSVSARSNNRNNKIVNTKKSDLRENLNLDEWKRKLNSVYGQHTSTKTRSTISKTKQLSPKHISSSTKKMKKPTPNVLNNAGYIPYSQLTLGGVHVSDIEKEISTIPDKGDLPLNSIVDKILGSKENSFHRDSLRSNLRETSPKVLSTSDENLLQEVMAIEKTINETLSKTVNGNIKSSERIAHNEDSNSRDDNTYADDFEDENSDISDLNSSRSKKQIVNDEALDDNNDVSHTANIEVNKKTKKLGNKNQQENIQNTTYTKASNLSFKDGVDIFEFVHSVDTQDTGTQSNTTSKISLKETQTSPTNDRSNVQPIHNDLWPSIDPKREVEKLFQLEKEFIKKLIIDEYGEILEKSITKPSSSREKDRGDRDNNVKAHQKNTQTSPAHVKCAMTSPTRTKTRTTSPFPLVTTDRQTSPLEINEEVSKIIIDNDAEDIGISINLSSPRFSLRLPQNSREVISNLDNYNLTKLNEDEDKFKQETKTFKSYAISSSSSVDADNSSEISSLGEVRLKLRRKLKKPNRIHSVVASSSSSIVSQSSDIVSGDILPLKSEGELSLGQTIRKSRDRKDSDGEMNFEAR